MVLGYHVSAVEGRFFPLKISSALLQGTVITPWLKQEGMTFLKLQREAGGKERNTAGPANKQGCERISGDC